MSLRAGTKRKTLSTSGSPAAKRVKVEDEAMAGGASTAESPAPAKKAYAMKNRRTSGRGVAQKVAKKQLQKAKEKEVSPVSATEVDAGEHQRSSSPAETAEKAPEKVLSVDSTTEDQPAAGKSSLNGLLNSRNACFMNSVIQMMDAALEGRDIDQILANIDDLADLDDFEGHDLTKADLDASLDNMTGRRRGSRSKKVSPAAQKKETLRDAIKKVAKAGNTKALSVARHLRQLLEQMHEKKASKNEAYVSPFQFQQVFAFGKIEEAGRPITDTDDAKGRHWLSGDTQEDASQFYMALIDALQQDQHIAGAEKLKDLFTIGESEVIRCKEADCKHRTPRKQVTSTTYDIRVPRQKEGIELQSLLTVSMRNDHEGTCPKCGKQSLEQCRIITTPPQNLIVKLHRTDRKGKISTPVHLNPAFRACKKGYELVGVVKHKGQRANSGHYTFLRKRGKDWAGELVKHEWFAMDDDLVYPIKPEAVKDDAKGQCAMLLYKMRPED